MVHPVIEIGDTVIVRENGVQQIAVVTEVRAGKYRVTVDDGYPWNGRTDRVVATESIETVVKKANQ